MKKKLTDLEVIVVPRWVPRVLAIAMIVFSLSYTVRVARQLELHPALALGVGLLFAGLMVGVALVCRRSGAYRRARDEVQKARTKTREGLEVIAVPRWVPRVGAISLFGFSAVYTVQGAQQSGLHPGLALGGGLLFAGLMVGGALLWRNARNEA